MKKDKQILLSKKHGVNPSLMKCFWCSESVGVALLGLLPGDAEAPCEIVTSYEPCDECKKNMARGVTLLEVRPEPVKEQQPPIDVKRGLYPTGRWLVLKREAAMRLFSVELEDKAFVELEVMDMLLQMKKELEDKDNGTEE
jgi:hypothetical protein